MKNKHIPFRRCVVCKQSKEKNKLIRIVKNKRGNVDIDLFQNKEGRGTYICNEKSCIEKCIKKNKLIRDMDSQSAFEIYNKLKEINENY